MKNLTAKQAYYDWRVYQHFLKDLNLQDDSSSITVGDLQEFIKNCIPEEEYEELLKLCIEMY